MIQSLKNTMKDNTFNVNLVYIVDYFHPEKNSASIQSIDLVNELSKKKNILVLTPNHNSHESEERPSGNVYVKRISPFFSRKRSRLKRFLSEILWPINVIFFLLFTRKINLNSMRGIIWYSPSIFHGPIISFLKKRFKAKSYLILRDIFPKWAKDLGIIKNEFLYKFLRIFENYQYNLADTIGVQSIGNIEILKSLHKADTKIEVLNNWLTADKKFISNNSTNVKQIIYSGNLGIAQGFESIMPAIKNLRNFNNLKFLLIGSGESFQYIMDFIDKNKLKNVELSKEIDNKELLILYKESNYGLVSLDLRHKTNNIPGKFVSYMHYGLPCISISRRGDDLSNIIENNNLGICSNSLNAKEISSKIIQLINKDHQQLKRNCLNYALKEFSTGAIATKIMETFNN